MRLGFGFGLVLASVLSVGSLVGAVGLGGASAAMALPPTPPPSTTTYGAPVLVPGAPTGVTGDSIEYGGKLITTVLHADSTFTIESFDGTTFTVLTSQFLDAKNFVIWRSKLVFSAKVAGGWEIYVSDGTTFTAINAINGLLSASAQEITLLDEYVIFTFDAGASAVLVGWGGTVNHVVFYVTEGDAFSGLMTFNDALLFNVYTAGVSAQTAMNFGSRQVLQADMACDVGIVWEGSLYRSCGNDTDGYHLWVLTVGGSFTEVAGSPLSPESLAVFDGALYFTGVNGSAERLLYFFDGTAVAEVSAPPREPVFPDELAVVGDTLFMRVGNYPGTPHEGISWFNGSSFSAVPDAGGVSGAPFHPAGLISYGGSLYFTGTAVSGDEPRTFWRVSVAVPPAPPAPPAPPVPGPELASTGVSADAASASLMAGLMGGALLLAGLGALALRRRGLLRG